MKTLLGIAVLTLSLSTSAEEIFVLKKSMNPKNVLHFDAAVKDCKLVDPVVSNHWIMGEENGQREGLTSREKEYFEVSVTYKKDQEADFVFGALEQGSSSLPKKVTVRVEDCKAKAFVEIKNEEIELKQIYAQLSLFGSVKYMTIKGKKADGSAYEESF